MKERDLFDAHGYVVRKGLFSASEIAELTTYVDRIHAQWLATHQTDYIDHKLINMHSLTHPAYFAERSEERAAFFDRIASSKLVQYIDALSDERIYFHNTQLFFNPADPDKLPYWHRDMQNSAIEDAVQARELPNMFSLHVRIPLLRETGVALIPGTHRRWDTELECKVRFERDGHRNSEALPDAVLISLEPGDVLVFHAQMIHRGHYALDPARKALDLCVGNGHPLAVQFLDEAVLPNDEELEKIGNRQWYAEAKALVASRAARSATNS